MAVPYLALALLFGILLALGLSNGFFPVYIHLLVFGWLTQLIFGVVYWMFPCAGYLAYPLGNER